MAGDSSIDYNREVAASERRHGYLNAAIANLLKYHGNIEGDIEEVLNFYFLMCSVEMNCRELAHAFLPFADRHKPFSHCGVNLSVSKVKRINALMQTCGFYDEAGDLTMHKRGIRLNKQKQMGACLWFSPLLTNFAAVNNKIRILIEI